MPLPTLLESATLRAGVAAAITDPLDYAPGGAAVLFGAGLANRETGIGGELGLALYPCETREVPYTCLSNEFRIALAYDIGNTEWLDVPLRLGVGGRALFIDDQTVLEGHPLERQLGLEAVTPDSTIYGGTGLRLYMGGRVHLRVDVDAAAHFGMLPRWRGTHTFWEVTPSLSLELRTPPKLDGDHDGIPNQSDACPDVEEDRDGFEDGDGCPERDNDGDGIPDEKDGCPLEPEDIDGFKDADGCPESNNDLDEFPAHLDQCPNERESANGWQDGDGCPDVLPAALLDIELLALIRDPDPAAWARQMQEAGTRVSTALQAEPEARVMIILRGVPPNDTAPLVKVFQDGGLLPRVGMREAESGWPLPRPQPPEWASPNAPLVVFAVVDPVDAQGHRVPFRE
jgi:hypothetical protein